MKRKRIKLKWLLNHNKHLEKLKVRFRNNLKRKRRLLLGVNKVERKRRVLMRNFKDYTKVKVPNTFSLIKNTAETIKFIELLEDCFKQRKKVFVKLSGVSYIGEGALSVLLSSLINFRTNNIDFNGDFPKNQIVNKQLHDSGFFAELYNTKKLSPSDTYNLTNRTIFTHASKIVDAKLSSILISKISTKLWGEERRCLGVQRAYIELMQNTNNHASIGVQGEHHWWTTVSYDSSRNVACFAFLDYGVGIIKSITTDKTSKLNRIINLFKNLFNSKNDSELLELLLKGEIHNAGKSSSSTKQYYRGKGLPGIYEACKNNYLSNLVVISNKAMADVSNEKYVFLDTNFSGTFVYWELSIHNQNLPLCS